MARPADAGCRRAGGRGQHEDDISIGPLLPALFLYRGDRSIRYQDDGRFALMKGWHKFPGLNRAGRWRLLGLALVLLCLCGCAAQPGSGGIEGTPWEKAQEDPSELLKQAKATQSLGKINEALFYYASYLEHDPQNAEVLAAVGEIHLAKKNLDLAQVALDMSLAADPKLAKTHELEGLLLIQRNEYAGARAHFEKAVDLDPKLWRAQNGLGMIADREGRFDAADKAYNAALNVSPRNTQVMNNLGYSRYLRGDFLGALSEVDQLLRLAPKYESAVLNRGLYLLRLGQEEEAFADLKLVLSEADAYNNLGFLLMRDGQLEKARSYFEKAIAHSPHYHDLANKNLQNLARLEASQVSKP